VDRNNEGTWFLVFFTGMIKKWCVFRLDLGSKFSCLLGFLSVKILRD